VLQRRQLAALGEALDRAHVLADRVDREAEATQDRHAVDLHGAGAALAELAAVLGAGQVHLLTEHLQQGLVRRKRHFVRLAVHMERRQRLLGLAHGGRGH